MEELVIGDKTYIPSKKAAEITGYAKDYIGQLCREGRVEAKLVGRSWYVLETSIREHRFGSEATGSVAAETVTEQAPAAAAPSVAAETWDSPTYVSEPIEEVIPKLRPTFVENKPQIDEEKIADLQQSWEAWFSKPEVRQEEAQSELPEIAPEPIAEELEAEEMETEEVVQEEETHVALNRVNQPRFQSGSMDIRPLEREAAAVASPYVAREVRASRRERPLREAKKGSGMVSKALFVAFVVIIASIAAVGTGFFDSISNDAQFAAPIIDFIGGIDRTSK